MGLFSSIQCRHKPLFKISILVYSLFFTYTECIVLNNNSTCMGMHKPAFINTPHYRQSDFPNRSHDLQYRSHHPQNRSHDRSQRLNASACQSLKYGYDKVKAISSQAMYKTYFAIALSSFAPIWWFIIRSTLGVICISNQVSDILGKFVSKDPMDHEKGNQKIMNCISDISKTLSISEAQKHAIFIRINQIIARILLKLSFIDVKVYGYENFNDLKNVPALIVANHCSHLDVPVCVHCLPGNSFFIAKVDLLKVPIIGVSLQSSGSLYFDRKSTAAHLQLFRSVINRIQKFNADKSQPAPLFIGYPEGTRSIDGRLQSFKNGLFGLACKLGVPVIPVSICGMHKANPATSYLPEPGFKKISVHVHPMIHTKGRQVEEVQKQVWDTIASVLPADQKPI